MLRAAGSSSLCIQFVRSCPLAFLELWESLLPGAALWEGLQLLPPLPLTLGPLLQCSLFPFCSPCSPWLPWRAKHKLTLCSIIHSPQRTSKALPQALEKERDSLGGINVAISEQAQPGTSVVPYVTMSRPELLQWSWPQATFLGGKLPECLAGEDWGQVPIPLLLVTSLLGLESFFRRLGIGPMSLSMLSAYWW